MRYILFFVIVLFFGKLNGQDTYKIPDVPLMNSWNMIDFVHVKFTLSKDVKNVQIGEKIGEIQTYPTKLSQRFDNEIQQSIRYYDKGDYKQARFVLENPILIEPQNAFVLNTYARACYQIDKSTSFKVYCKLVAYLDSINNKQDSQIVIDVWFREAYWKLGTLYMDNKNWGKAEFEISRFLLSIQEKKKEYIYSQALEYLTECAYNQYNDKLALYLANRTLTYDSQNSYVKSILNKIKK